MQKTSNIVKDSSSTRNVLMFAIPSLLGILLFMTPVVTSGGFTIPIAVLAKTFRNVMGDSSTLIVTSIVLISAVGSLLALVIKPRFITDSKFLTGLFLPSPVWLVVRLLGAVFVSMAFFGFGLNTLWAEQLVGSY